MNLDNIKLYNLYQPIYDIIIRNNELYTKRYYDILINYSTLSEKSKKEIQALFTTETTQTTETTNDNNCYIDNSNINTTIKM